MKRSVGKRPIPKIDSELIQKLQVLANEKYGGDMEKLNKIILREGVQHLKRLHD